jgi:hypothetical protein
MSTTSTTVTTPTTSSSSSSSSRCAVCQTVATKKCSRCQTTWYCSVEHQKQDWKRHKRLVCNYAFQADQHTLHKREFDRIIQTYGLNRDDKATEIAEFLTTQQEQQQREDDNDDDNTENHGQTAAVSAPAFATKFGMKLEEAVVFLEWIKVGVRFKEQAIDTAKKSGFGGGVGRGSDTEPDTQQ